MGVKFLIRMTTDCGKFWWNGDSIYDRQTVEQSGMAFRSWGWLDHIERAQRFTTQGNAQRAAQRLGVELRRLYRVRIDVVEVTVTALGVRETGDE